jgi:hypothetical protein
MGSLPSLTIKWNGQGGGRGGERERTEGRYIIGEMMVTQVDGTCSDGTPPTILKTFLCMQ